MTLRHSNIKGSHGQPAALEALQCGFSTVPEKCYFEAKSTRSLEKNPNFGPQNYDFLEMWPSSRFGLAMADQRSKICLNNKRLLLTLGLSIQSESK
jgi:hypothetical protein